MSAHRLPGMSIPAEDWDALTDLAARVGTNRSELIRMFIRTGVGDSTNTEVRLQETEYELHQTQHELRQARQQLDSVRRQLEAIATATRLAEGVVTEIVAA